MTVSNQTIAAIATASGRGGVGIIRISGKSLLPLAKTITKGKIPLPRTALYTDFYDENGEVIDNGIILYFPAPASFTGEDVIELQGHGGLVVMQMLLQRCLQLGARIAQAGEFSKRAFLNNKLDLAQAESVADLIDASSTTAARMAMRSLKGVFSHQIHKLVEDLITLRMLVEATLDFPEEEIDFLEAANAKGKLKHLQNSVSKILKHAKQGAVLREGMNVVLVGAPNVGKSSLLNALAGDDIAIVSDVAGTTRDTVREQIILDGIPIHIIDTAGLRESNDFVEKIGMQRSQKAINEADIVLLLLDPAEGLNDSVRQILEQLPQNLPCIEIHNKSDLRGMKPVQRSEGGFTRANKIIELSAKTGEGLDLLKQALLAQTAWQGENEGLFLARSRHVHALQNAQIELDNAELCCQYQQLELFAEHLRLAQQSCNEITGEFGADDLLGVIFSRFCIGK